MNRKYSKKSALDPSQELFALGAMNFFGSFLQAFPVAGNLTFAAPAYHTESGVTVYVSGSFSRTAVNAASGARSPIAGLFDGIVVFMALYLVTPALQYIPKAVLSAIIVVSVVNLIDFKSAIRYWRVERRWV